MRYGILGPLTPAVTAGRDRIVLAMLLLHADRVVSVGELIDAVWDEDPPSTARAQLQTCVSRLRRALPAGVIDTDPAGYRIRVGPDELDSLVHARLIARARAEGDAALFHEALALWRGPALVEIESPAVRRAAAVLDEQRAVATEDWIDLELAAGHERELLGELSGLVEEFPLRERLRGQLMVALSRSGRQADALAEYRRIRDVLAGELGIEPGHELRELHQRILGDTLPPAEAAAGPVRCLPRTVGDFTGRAEIVARLLATIDGPGPAIAVIDGMAGSGKTTLALHLAALVGDRYPDAHLFVDLHGHSAEQPLDPAAALLILLRQLGVHAERVPPALVDRLALWRTELARRRVLVLFDNVAASDQIADLLPTAPGSLALVTSRRRMTALDDVRPESLPVLAEPEAIALLARIAGERVSAEPDAAAEVVRRCGGLPLALRLAGARLAHRPSWRVSDLLRRLGGSMLPELAVESRTVAGAFALSFGQLTEPAQRLFRLLGAYPGRSFDALAAAAVADLPLPEAEDLLDDLVDAHLVDEPERGVFRMHDLLHEYAIALCSELSADERRAAVVRALDLEMHAAMMAVPYRISVTLRDLGYPVAMRPDLLAGLADAAERLERTRPALGDFQDAAIAADRPDLVWKVARAAWRFLLDRGYTDDVERIFSTARAVARRAGDRAAQGLAANYLASVYFRQCRLEMAKPLVEECIRLREELGDQIGAAVATCNLATLHNSHGRYAEGAAYAERAQVLYSGSRAVESSMQLDVASFAYSYLGRHAEAINLQRRRLLHLVELGDRFDIAHSLLHLILVRFRAGAIEPALAGRRLRLIQHEMVRLGLHSGECDVLYMLGDVLRSQGRYEEAIAEFVRARELIVAIHDGRMEPIAINGHGQALLESGDPDAALAIFRQGLERSLATTHWYERGRAHLGIGDCLAATDPAGAREHWRQALEVFTEIQVPERYEVERRLVAVAS
ncbi:tetratricopeptide repeat protein [Actinoplanes sp. KI2]|uniref:AfsR/SARP family transcriptional regulator n=1 Tax=Actinoplanes sp. KI2 TaxID=2983315 RepID=UPI0021D578BF|nr:BTAD domain-containing putative transcriptional regulator [Actinoplanes sp. KI2]MCU7727225.1 tetratricopeptide repeat protein [Actinoplanes sp. KI2]